MIQVKLAWSAFKNMARRAADDPLWALVALIFLPFRAWKPFLMGFVMLLAVLLVVVFGGRTILEVIGLGPGSLLYGLVDPLAWLIAVVLASRHESDESVRHLRTHEELTPV